jgi:hypothetical protein
MVRWIGQDTFGVTAVKMMRLHLDLFFELLEEYVTDRELHGPDAIKIRFMEMMQKR